MEELLGLPDWLLAGLFVVAGLSIAGAFAWRNTRRQIAATAARRPNPTREEFMALLASGVSDDTSDFLWETISYYSQGLGWTPHPEDDLLTELPIDHDDISMDWPRQFAERRGYHESNLADWPEGWPVTVRNFGRWLDLGSNPPASART